MNTITAIEIYQIDTITVIDKNEVFISYILIGKNVREAVGSNPRCETIFSWNIHSDKTSDEGEEPWSGG